MRAAAVVPQLVAGGADSIAPRPPRRPRGNHRRRAPGHDATNAGVFEEQHPEAPRVVGDARPSMAIGAPERRVRAPASATSAMAARRQRGRGGERAARCSRIRNGAAAALTSDPAGCATRSRSRSSRSSQSRNCTTSTSTDGERASTSARPSGTLAADHAAAAQQQHDCRREDRQREPLADVGARAALMARPRSRHVPRSPSSVSGRRAGCARRILDADDARQAELAGDDGAVRQHAAALDDEAGDQAEHGPPSRIGLARDEHVAARAAGAPRCTSASTAARADTRPPHALVPVRSRSPAAGAWPRVGAARRRRRACSEDSRRRGRRKRVRRRIGALCGVLRCRRSATSAADAAREHRAAGAELVDLLPRQHEHVVATAELARVARARRRCASATRRQRV